MDWAVRSARKKTKFLQGGSRSIVESLNRFNEVILEGQDAISSACIASSQWLEDELNKIKSDIPQEEPLVSPEKSGIDEKVALEESTPQKMDRADLQATPRSIPEVERSAETKSRSTENNAERSVQPVNLSSKGSGGLKSSPWSPYKSERNATIRSSVQPLTGTASGLSNENTELNRFPTNEYHASSRTRNITNSPTLAVSESNHSVGAISAKIGDDQKIEKPLFRDRTQRRSNMFVPLPDKDPLILPAANGWQSKKPSLDLTAKSQDYTTKSQDFTTATSNIKAFNFKTETSATDSKSPTAHFNNVFDRLSSKSTKSFDKKASSRSPTRDVKKLKPKSTIIRDGQGSPIQRRPLRADHTNRSIQETLKSIFDTQIPKLPQSEISGKLTNEKLYVDGNTKVVKRNSLIPKLSGRTATSPSLSGKILSGQTTRLPFSASLQISPSQRRTHVSNLRSEAEANENATPPQTLSAHKKKDTLPKSPYHEDLFEKKAAASIASVHANNTDMRNESQLAERRSSFHNNAKAVSVTKRSSPKQRQAQDRLTKFQLLPLAVSEKQDVKKKLDKRLSEVMRSQKEQQKRSQGKLKRMSHLEEEQKQRKSRIFQDIEDRKTAKGTHLVPGNVENQTTTKVRNTMLYDLNTSDHRQFLNGPQDDTNVADTTLPDIDSDSDAEDRSILAPWAQAPFLQEQLLAQQDWDPEKIFGPIPPLHTDEIFRNSRLSKLKSRQSLSRSVPNPTSELRK